MPKKRGIVCGASIAYLAVCSLLYAKDDAPASLDSLDPLAIVILPVEVLSAETGMDELAGVIQEEFYSQVGTIEGLHIVEPDLVRPYARSGLDSKEIARELGAATVLDSSVSARPDGYEIRYAFVNVQTGKRYSSGSGLGRGKWGPGFTLDAQVRDIFSRIIQNVEWSLFPDRRMMDYEIARAEAKAALLNTGLSDGDRLTALRTLTPGLSSEHQAYADGGLSLTGEIALAAIQLATQSSNPFIRASVWHIMRWVPDPNLIEPLLHALAHDKNASVRKAAAMALEIHKGSANVRAALRDAAEFDLDPQVRREAEFSAADADEQWTLLSRTVMDATLPDSERRYALIRLRSSDQDTRLSIDSPLVTATLQWVETAESPGLRTTIWWSLHQLVGSAIAAPAIDALFADPSENTREALASLLSEYLDEPGVTDALQKAKATDNSPLVAAAATCSLQGGGWC